MNTSRRPRNVVTFRRGGQRRRGGPGLARHLSAVDALQQLLDAPGPRPAADDVPTLFLEALRGLEDRRGSRFGAALLLEIAAMLTRLAEEFAVLLPAAAEGEPPRAEAAERWLTIGQQLVDAQSAGAGLGAALCAKLERDRGIPPVRAELTYSIACCTALAGALRTLGAARASGEPEIH